MTEWVTARNVAKRLGIQTSTLRKWRSRGQGPRGAIKLKGNLVVYPKARVDDFFSEYMDEKTVLDQLR